MDLEKLRKEWDFYNFEFENNEYMDIEKHIAMARKVGGLINEIEQLNNSINFMKTIATIDIKRKPAKEDRPKGITIPKNFRKPTV